MKKAQDQLCTVKNHNSEKFLEVCLLLLLYDEAWHGYGLIEQLKYFGFTQDSLNVSTLYRTLRKMEKEKLVSSFWEEKSSGPKKRVYKINDYGKKSLKQWVDFLEIRQLKIGKLIRKYEEKIKNERKI